MAGIAGSVAPVFRDEGYVATEKYDFYHALIHNNKLYFCRQDGTIGHEPQEVSDDYWFLSLDGTFADAASLGGETAEVWQSKLDSIQTTSRATLSQAGWYRVAEYSGTGLHAGHMKGSGSNSCIINIRRSEWNNVDESLRVQLMSHTHKQSFDILAADSSYHAFTKIRYAYNETDLKAYIEVYYNKDNDEICTFAITDSFPTTGAWQAITPTLTEETVDGVTVTTTYDIPANASPVTDLDLDVLMETYDKYPAHDVSDISSYDSYSANFPNGTYYRAKMRHAAQISPLTGGDYFLIGFKTSSDYEWQIAKSYNAKNIFIRDKIGGKWNNFDKCATTSDLATALAGYLALDGGSSVQTVSASAHMPITINNTHADSTGTMMRFSLRGTEQGGIGYENGIPNVLFDGHFRELFHTGNSAKVIQSTTAPSDATAVWIDTTNKKLKAYIDGAWTVIA